MQNWPISTRHEARVYLRAGEKKPSRLKNRMTRRSARASLKTRLRFWRSCRRDSIKVSSDEAQRANLLRSNGRKSSPAFAPFLLCDFEAETRRFLAVHSEVSFAIKKGKLSHYVAPRRQKQSKSSALFASSFFGVCF